MRDRSGVFRYYWGHVERYFNCQPPSFTINGHIEKVTMNKPPREVLRLIEVLEVSNADAVGGEPIFSLNNEPLGRVTSGAYCSGVNKSLALAFIKNKIEDKEVNVMILGRPHLAKILSEPPFDPKGLKLRA